MLKIFLISILNIFVFAYNKENIPLNCKKNFEKIESTLNNKLKDRNIKFDFFNHINYCGIIIKNENNVPVYIIFTDGDYYFPLIQENYNMKDFINNFN